MSKIGEGKGKPTLQSDLGKEFKNTEVKKVTEQYNYNHTFGLPGKPQGQGMVERFNRTIKKALRQWLISTDNVNWNKALNNLVNGEKGYNKQRHSSIGMSPEKALNGVMSNDQEVIKNIKDQMIKRTIGSDKFKRSPSEWNDIAVGDIVRLRLYPGLRKLVFAWTMQVFRVTKVIKSKFTRRTIAKDGGEDLQTQTQTVTTYRVTPVVFEGGGDYKDGVWVKQSEADKYVDDKSSRAVLIGKEYSRNLTRAELQKIRKDLPADVAPWSNKKKVKERDITQRKLILKQAEEQQKKIDADN